MCSDRLSSGLFHGVNNSPILRQEEKVGTKIPKREKNKPRNFSETNISIHTHVLKKVLLTLLENILRPPIWTNIRKFIYHT